MQITVADYKNRKLNSASTDETYTRDCVLITSADGSRLGGVDHYTKKSVKQIVSYYVRRMERESYDKGFYMVNIVIGEGSFGRTTGTIAIQIEVA